MSIGQRPFHRAFTDTDAEETTLADDIRGIAKLGRRIDLGRKKSVDTPGEVFGILLGEGASRNGQPGDTGEHQERRTSDEVHHAPGKEDQAGLPEVRL